MNVAPPSDNGTLHFASLRASRLFPGRSSLYVHEVSRVLLVTEKHLLSLIDEDVIHAVRINGATNKSARSNYRIPVAEYDRFILAGGTPKNGRVKAAVASHAVLNGRKQ